MPIISRHLQPIRHFLAEEGFPQFDEAPFHALPAGYGERVYLLAKHCEAGGLNVSQKSTWVGHVRDAVRLDQELPYVHVLPDPVL